MYKLLEEIQREKTARIRKAEENFHFGSEINVTSRFPRKVTSEKRKVKSEMRIFCSFQNARDSNKETKRLEKLSAWKRINLKNILFLHSRVRLDVLFNIPYYTILMILSPSL